MIFQVNGSDGSVTLKRLTKDRGIGPVGQIPNDLFDTGLPFDFEISGSAEISPDAIAPVTKVRRVKGFRSDHQLSGQYIPPV